MTRDEANTRIFEALVATGSTSIEAEKIIEARFRAQTSTERNRARRNRLRCDENVAATKSSHPQQNQRSATKSSHSTARAVGGKGGDSAEGGLDNPSLRSGLKEEVVTRAKLPCGEFDWESSDGTIFITAAQIDQWAQKFEGVNIRAQLRAARRQYLSGPMTTEVFCRRFEKGLETKAANKRAKERAKGVVSAAQISAQQAMEDEYEERQRAYAVRQRLLERRI
jgi:hypothetical protein